MRLFLQIIGCTMVAAGGAMLWASMSERASWRVTFIAASVLLAAGSFIVSLPAEL